MKIRLGTGRIAYSVGASPAVPRLAVIWRLGYWLLRLHEVRRNEFELGGATAQLERIGTSLAWVGEPGL
jgi:hypothetical protein